MGRLKNLDDKVLGRQDSPAVRAREAWGRKHGWSLLLLMGIAGLVIAAWALSVPDRPATAAMSLSWGAGAVGLSVWLFFRRDRS